MIERCTREAHPRFEDYGGRGVCVDPRWRGKGGFARFLADVGERPADKTLDRIDCNGHYTPGNVKWSTLIEQRWNRRDMIERAPDAPDDQRVPPPPWPVATPEPPADEEWPF